MYSIKLREPSLEEFFATLDLGEKLYNPGCGSGNDNSSSWEFLVSFPFTLEVDEVLSWLLEYVVSSNGFGF